MIPSQLFTDKTSLAKRNDVVRDSHTAFLQAFPGQESARQFLRRTILPPSRRWAFLSTDKNGSSSALRYLFHIEFGVPLNAAYTSLVDINPSAVVHLLAEHDVFSRAIYLGLSAGDLRDDAGLERIAIIRNPYSRAASAFRYFCTSQDKASGWFLGDRLRINATVGFDWQTMPRHVGGFRLFLHYIEAEIARVGLHRINGHWKPQSMVICPDVFRPTLLGRLENMDGFYMALAERFGPAGQDIPTPVWENRQPNGDDELETDPQARRLVERIYNADFESFNY